MPVPNNWIYWCQSAYYGCKYLIVDVDTELIETNLNKPKWFSLESQTILHWNLKQSSSEKSNKHNNPPLGSQIDTNDPPIGS